jgi:glycosyltransferase involved in cell wall biosynthesis
MSWSAYCGTPITVIPCSADTDLFTLSDPKQKAQARERLKVSPDSFVLSYLGSLGTWYLVEEMVFLFKLIKEVRTGSKFLILTPDDPQEIYSIISKFGLAQEDFIVRFAPRSELPLLLKASDVSVSFIKPVYSKIGSSPTKMGELLAMGIPVICNDIGDVGNIVEKTNGGIVVAGFDRNSLLPAVEYVKSLDQSPPINRQKVLDYYSLTNAVDKYHKVYQTLSPVL